MKSLFGQFGNSEVQKIYDHWMFAEPLEFQSKVFCTLMEIGIIPKSDSGYLAVKYYALIYFFCSKVVILRRIIGRTKKYSNNLLTLTQRYRLE